MNAPGLVLAAAGLLAGLLIIAVFLLALRSRRRRAVESTRDLERFGQRLDRLHLPSDPVAPKPPKVVPSRVVPKSRRKTGTADQ